MGCGHSKINIYPRKSKTKNNSRKTVTPEKAESEEEEGVENDSENNKDLEDCDPKKTIKVKPFGGPLLAQVDISSSQQDFFKMLDEKIQNGPDYNSEGETEREVENARIRALLKDWETASSGSRSLPSTPKRRPPLMMRSAMEGSHREAAAVRVAADGTVRGYPLPQSAPLSQSVIHQSYGITQIYRQVNYAPNHPNYISQGSPSSHPTPHPAAYASALQYQAISPPMYPPHPTSISNQPPYPPSLPPRQYPSYNQYGTPIPTFSNMANNSTSGSPIRHHHIPATAAYVEAAHLNQPMGTAYAEAAHLNQPMGTAYSSPSHKLYGSPVQVAKQQPIYSNGEVAQQQQQMYNHQIQYQQYKESREHQQLLLQTQQPPQGSYRQVPRSYQTSVTIPIVVKSNNNDSVNSALHRKQYELT